MRQYFFVLLVTGDMYSRGSAPGPAASTPAGPTAPGGSAAGQQKSGSEYGGGYSSYSGYQVTQRTFYLKNAVFWDAALREFIIN
jgi:hypothetical protein